jgi:hypothetical protein
MRNLSSKLSNTASDLNVVHSNLAAEKTEALLDKELLTVQDVSNSQHLQEQFLDLAFGLLRQQSTDVMLSKETVANMNQEQK